MFKFYRDIGDVVTLLVYCPSERSFLLVKESNGEYWLPCAAADKRCWKVVANKMFSDLFGIEPTTNIQPLRIYKLWLPNHTSHNVYHVIYKATVKSDVKKKTKLRSTARSRVSWMNNIELDRQRAHALLRSPEVAIFGIMAVGDPSKEIDIEFYDDGLLVEVCEDNVLLSSGPGAAGAASIATMSNYQLLQAAGYKKDDQTRFYREFMLSCFPALYMSPQVFTTFMTDLGWQRTLCVSLFRAADQTGRGGLTFQETLLWCAAIEPGTQHAGVTAEMRCRYIFRYYDNNRDGKLEYVEFKELVAAARLARQMPADALSVAREADACLRQLGIQGNSQLPLAEFMRCVGELRLRGTSSMLRSPRSPIAYLQDLQEIDRYASAMTGKGSPLESPSSLVEPAPAMAGTPSGGSSRKNLARADYSVATYTLHMRKEACNQMLELNHFDEVAVSPSTQRVMQTDLGLMKSVEVLGPATIPMEAMAAVHYFATPIEKIHSTKITYNRRMSQLHTPLVSKPAWSWASANEAASMGSLLLKLAEAVRPICTSEPRLLRVHSPVYAIGDLHGNLSALLAIETALWPSGAALSPAKILFLGDFVDRGQHGTELMAYLLAAKLQRPNGVLLIRGNHETRDIQKMFTFHTECISKYGEAEGVKVWNAINLVFDSLPLAAVVDGKVFCCHGGIPPPWVCPLMSAIDKIPVPLPRPAEQSTIAWELLWNDPVKPNKLTGTLVLELTANEGFAPNARRGTGHVFDQTALDRFLLANQLSHVVRAHELHQNGFMCQLRGRLVSVFSSTNYCGGTNDAGVALLEGGKLRLIRVGPDDH